MGISNQMFTFAEVETYIPTLDLTNHSDFRVITNSEGEQIYGKYIYERGTDLLPRNVDIRNTTDMGIYTSEPSFFTMLKRLFFNQPGTERYRSSITVFYFNESAYDSFEREFQQGDNTLLETGITRGETEEIGIKNLVIFKESINKTLCHEVLHTLGLYHPFSINSHNPYIFTQNETDNIMDYSPVRPFTWAWQWKIINNRL